MVDIMMTEIHDKRYIPVEYFQNPGSKNFQRSVSDLKYAVRMLVYRTIYYKV